MYEKDGIVYADNQTPQIKVKSVKANDDYTLLIRFSNGEQRVFSASNLLEQGVFKALKDINFFKQAYIDYGTVVWDNRLDICPDYLYKHSNELPV